MSELNETVEMSLADLADIDVSGVAEVRFELLPTGIYVWEITEADMHEGHNKDNEKRFHAEVSMKLIEVKSVLEAGVDKDSLVGKTYTEKLFLTPGDEQEKVMAAIGRIKAFVLDVGGEWSAGLIDNVRNLKGLTFTGKIVHQVDKNDKSVKYARLKLDPKK